MLLLAISTCQWTQVLGLYKIVILSYVYVLFQIIALRAVFEQIKRLLSKQEQEELRMSEAFMPFAGLNPLQYNPYTLPLWKAAVSQYERALTPCEQRVAGKLRNQFRGLETNAQQVRFEWKHLYMKLYVIVWKQL